MAQGDLTLEKLKVVERLNELEKTNAVIIEKIDTQHQMLKDLEESLASYMQKMDHIVIGNGKIGLVGKVDSLEKLRNHINFLWGAVVVAAIKSTIDYITKHVN